MNIIIFMIGFLVGTVAGIFAMCLVQINRDSEAQLEKISRQEEMRKEEEEKCKETS